jgi:hypothetical protein
MGVLFQPWHIVLLLFVACLLLLPAIFYVFTLQRALNKCAADSRTIEPSKIWFYLIPIFNLVFHFFIVLNMAKSLNNEFKRRGVGMANAKPGETIGLVMCICGVCKIIPYLNVVAYVVYLIPWIAYWTQIAKYSRNLDQVPQTGLSTGNP